MDVNYFGMVNVVRAVVPSMIERRRGSIVGVSSAAGLVGVFGYSAYTPTKFAVRGFLETLRAELAPYGIHVGCSFPPDTDTPQLADEEQYKPKETKAISGTIKPLSAERVAANILDGIEKERFARTRLERDGPSGAQGRGICACLVAKLRDHREVVGAPHAVDRHITRDLRGEHVADAAELRVADHHVIDAAFEVKAGGRERVVVRPRVAGTVVARGLPRVAEHDARDGRRGPSGQHADLVARRVGVEVAAQHGRERAGPLVAHELADVGDLALPDRAVVVGPAEVRAEHLDRPARTVDLGEDAQAFLALVRTSCRAIGQRESTALPDRAPSRSRFAAYTGSP